MIGEIENLKRVVHLEGQLKKLLEEKSKTAKNNKEEAFELFNKLQFISLDFYFILESAKFIGSDLEKEFKSCKKHLFTLFF